MINSTDLIVPLRSRTEALSSLITEQGKSSKAPPFAVIAAQRFAAAMLQKGASASTAERWSRAFLRRWAQPPTDTQLIQALGWIIIHPDQCPTGHRHNAGAVRAGYRSLALPTAAPDV